MSLFLLSTALIFVVSDFVIRESGITALFMLSLPGMNVFPVNSASGCESIGGFGVVSLANESTCAASLVTANNKISTNAVLLKPSEFYLLVKNLQFCVKLWDFSI